MNMHKDEERQEEAADHKTRDVPLHLKHRPILGLENYEYADGNKAGASEAKGLSIGLAQWNTEETSEVSAKIWRHTGEKWSRQSEEMALHRIVDLTILIARTRLLFKRFKPTMLKEKSGYPLIDEFLLQGERLPVSVCDESETFSEDVIKFEKAMTKEERILRERFDTLTEILTETERVSTERQEVPCGVLPVSERSEEPPKGSETSEVRGFFERFTLKDMILTSIAFISIMCALFFAGKVQDLNDLSLSPEDVLISETGEDTVDLWIRQKNGIESVMITKQIIDYGLGTGHFTCIDPGSHLADEGEKRLIEGVFFGADEKGYPLVDSTTERHPRLGAAYHLVLPREILYQTGDGDYHALSLYHGSPLTITSFSEDFADYSEKYRINPFTLHIESWPSDEPYYGTYSLTVLAEEMKGIDAQLREDFAMYQEGQEERMKALRTEGVVIATELQDDLDGLEERLYREYAVDRAALLQSADEAIAELTAADSFMKEEITLLLDALYVDVADSLKEIEASLLENVRSGDELIIEELEAYQSAIESRLVESPAMPWSVGPSLNDMTDDSLSAELEALEKALAAQKERLDAQYASFTAYFDTVNGRVDDIEAANMDLGNTGRDQSVRLDDMYITIESAMGEMARLRNAVLTFNNMGVFGSIKPISKDVVKNVLQLKGSNSELTQQEAMESLQKDGYSVSPYEMFLIFSVYFNEYKL